jgi:hypothetical protein
LATTESKIEVGLGFNGDRRLELTPKDADYKTLLEVMFRNRNAWSAEVNQETGIVTLRPVAGVGKVQHTGDSQ